MRTLERCLNLPGRPASAGSARRFVAEALRDHGAESLTDVGVLLTSELVTNAVVHAQSDVEVTIGFSPGLVRIEVGDTSPVAPGRRHAAAGDLSGRGIGLVDRLSSAWGVNRRAGGKVVWFELCR